MFRTGSRDSLMERGDVAEDRYKIGPIFTSEKSPYGNRQRVSGAPLIWGPTINIGLGSAVHREVRCTASGTRSLCRPKEKGRALRKPSLVGADLLARGPG